MFLRVFCFFNFLLLSVCSFSQTIFNNQLNKVDSNFLFTEGPYWHRDGYLLFSDIDANKMYKWDAVHGTVVYLNSSGKSNGICGDVHGNLYVAQHSRKVSKIDSLGNVSVIASLYQGDSLNSPNDIVVRANGFIYFTDPNYGITGAQQELPYQGVYCIKQPGDSLMLLIDSLQMPNGIAFSPDEQRLYLCNSANSKIYYYEIKQDGSLKPGKFFAKLKTEIDGIKTDLDGNVYVAASFGGVKIFTSGGVLFDSIVVPEKVRNLAWGDQFRNTLYITAGNSIYSFHRNANYPFVLNELLGRPTAQSIDLSMMSEENLEVYIVYGTQSGNYSWQTFPQNAAANVPFTIKLTGLNADSRYYYRVRFRYTNDAVVHERSEHSCITRRNTNQSFVFDIQADPHLDAGSNYDTYSNAMQNTLNDNPDFLIDLGDNLMTEKLAVASDDNIEKRSLLLRHFYEKVGASVPLFLVIGNHESELGWLNDGTAGNIAVRSTNIRKKYFPNPEPDGFYSGDTTHYQYIGRRQSYYAWTWGDALFMVLDPYWFVSVKPSQSADMWDWTLGEEQYQWFKNTLENSQSKYKFVFSHQLVGGGTDGQGRGGAEFAPYYENGGMNTDSTWGFTSNRPAWSKTMHQLMRDNCVTAFFHGHDHLYAKQIFDSLIYQEVPQPSLMNYTQTSAAIYGYQQGVILPNSGYLRVTVGDSVSIEYVRAYHINNPANGWINGQVSDAYSVKACDYTGVRSINPDTWQVYPNPTDGLVQIKANTIEQETNFNVYSSTGKLVKSGNFSANQPMQVNLSDCANGLYLIHLCSNHQNQLMKIILQK